MEQSELTFDCHSGDVVLDEDGNAVQRSASPENLPLDVQLCGLRQSTGIGLEDRTQCRSLEVNFLNPREVRLRVRVDSVSHVTNKTWARNEVVP